MNRRNFLRNLIGGVAATAAVRTWPFRVYSFPSEIVRPLSATAIQMLESPGRVDCLDLRNWGRLNFIERPFSHLIVDWPLYNRIHGYDALIETPVPKGNLTAMQ